MDLIQVACGLLRVMKPAALKPRPASADIKRRAPATSTSRDWDSTVHDLGEYRLSEKQLQAKVQARHATSKVIPCFVYFHLCCTLACSLLRPHRWTTTPWLSCRSGRTYSARRTQVSRRWAAGARGRTVALLHIGINSSYFACMACLLPPLCISPL